VLKQRVITAIVLAILMLAALFALPRTAWAVLVLGIVLVGTAEWGRLSQWSRAGSRAYWVVTLVVMIILVYINLHDDRSRVINGLIDGVAAIFWLTIVPTWLVAGWRLHSPLLMALTGWVVLVPTGLAMLDLRDYSPWLLLGVMALVWVADTAAYFTGRRFGKHKLAPSISPGKTWEGVAGAILAVSLYAAIAYLAKGIWQSGQEGNHPVFLILVAASWLWVALAVLGDLFESAVKRQAGVKDSGRLLPGHGGLLDRIDALTSTLPLAALALLIQKWL
jgi:phosphatidate cytidylyltransferase